MYFAHVAGNLFGWLAIDETRKRDAVTLHIVMRNWDVKHLVCD